MAPAAGAGLLLPPPLLPAAAIEAPGLIRPRQSAAIPDPLPPPSHLLQEGAHFYVCGDAGSMAGAVEAQLLRIIEGGLGSGGGGAEAAAAYLQQLADTGRYQRDVWLS